MLEAYRSAIERSEPLKGTVAASTSSLKRCPSQSLQGTHVEGMYRMRTSTAPNPLHVGHAPSGRLNEKCDAESPVTVA